jgi:hypothetical protein
MIHRGLQVLPVNSTGILHQHRVPLTRYREYTGTSVRKKQMSELGSRGREACITELYLPECWQKRLEGL